MSIPTKSFVDSAVGSTANETDNLIAFMNALFAGVPAQHLAGLFLKGLNNADRAADLYLSEENCCTKERTRPYVLEFKLFSIMEIVLKRDELNSI